MVIDEAAKALISYGALGVVALAAIAAAVYLYRDAKAERDRNRAELIEIYDKHNAEKSALVERHVAKAESWTTRYHELAEAQVRSMDSLQALVGRLEQVFERQFRDPRGGR